MVGDVYGCVDLLNKFLIKIDKDRVGKFVEIILLGDYVDWGLFFCKVVEKFVLGLVDEIIKLICL